MAPTLYTIRASPPVRAVLITAKAIGLKLIEKEVDFFHNEHQKPEFIQLNPQKTVPTFVDDDGFAVWDSHAIMVYLVSKYAKNDDLYPNDPQKRAIVNQRLFFESGVVFFHAKNIAHSIINEGQKIIDPRELEGVFEAYEILEKFLDGKEWFAGDFLSIADYSLISSVSSLDRLIPIDGEKYPNLVTWLEKCENLPEYEANRIGLKEGSEMLKARLSMK